MGRAGSISRKAEACLGKLPSFQECGIVRPADAGSLGSFGFGRSQLYGDGDELASDHPEMDFGDPLHNGMTEINSCG